MAFLDFLIVCLIVSLIVGMVRKLIADSRSRQARQQEVWAARDRVVTAMREEPPRTSRPTRPPTRNSGGRARTPPSPALPRMPKIPRMPPIPPIPQMPRMPQMPQMPRMSRAAIAAARASLQAARDATGSSKAGFDSAQPVAAPEMRSAPQAPHGSRSDSLVSDYFAAAAGAHPPDDASVAQKRAANAPARK
jgi:hypothetical protein